MNVFRFFLIFEFFFIMFLKNDQVTKFKYRVSQIVAKCVKRRQSREKTKFWNKIKFPVLNKILRVFTVFPGFPVQLTPWNIFSWKDYTLMKFLDNRTKRFANTTKTFFDKRDFQKLKKNREKFICIRTNWQIDFGWKESYVTGFLVE